MSTTARLKEHGLSSRSPAVARFHALIDRDKGGCWIWRGEIKADGYGRFGVNKRNQSAHRYAYELLVGPIPDGLELDHLCRVPACVNPAHLEPVTQKENVLRSDGLAGVNARKTHCKRGHEFTSENTRRQARSDGRVGRACRKCDALWKLANRPPSAVSSPGRSER